MQLFCLESGDKWIDYLCIDLADCLCLDLQLVNGLYLDDNQLHVH